MEMGVLDLHQDGEEGFGFALGWRLGFWICIRMEMWGFGFASGCWEAFGASEPARRALETAGRASEPARRALDTPRRASEPDGRASEPAGRTSKLVRRTSGGYSLVLLSGYFWAT